MGRAQAVGLGMFELAVQAAAAGAVGVLVPAAGARAAFLVALLGVAVVLTLICTETMRAGFNALLAESPRTSLAGASAVLISLSLFGSVVGIVISGVGVTFLPFWLVVI